MSEHDLGGRCEMSATTHEAFGGITVDHLYQNCPGLLRAIRSPRHNWDLILGAELAVGVDPLGTDICGWCRRKWEGTQ